MNQNTPEIETILELAGERSLESTLFNFAHSYARAGELSVKASIENRDADFFAPAIMCKSFAVELLLKFFIALRYPSEKTYSQIKDAGEDLRGHNYQPLFERVQEEYQQKIANSFSSIAGRKTGPDDFNLILREIGDDSYVKWRYIYEKDKAGIQHFNVQLFDNVLEALGKAAEFERKRLNSSKA